MSDLTEILRAADSANWREYGQREMRQYIGSLGIVIAAPKGGGPVLRYVPGGKTRTGVTVGPFTPAPHPYYTSKDGPMDWHKPQSATYDPIS